MRLDVLEEFAELQQRWYPFVPEIKASKDQKLGFNDQKGTGAGRPKQYATKAEQRRAWKANNREKYLAAKRREYQRRKERQREQVQGG